MWAKAIDRFYRVEASRSRALMVGLGLGASVCKAIVGGAWAAHLCLAGLSGAGCQIVIRLPKESKMTTCEHPNR